MTTAVPISLSAPSGATLYAGLYKAGMFGNISLADVVASGSAYVQQSSMAGSVLLDDLLPTGSISMSLAPGNARIAIWGQSNAIGRANRTDISASPLSSDAGLSLFDGGTFSRVYIWDQTSLTYQKLQPSVNNQCSAGQFGPEFGLAVRWMRETTSGLLFIDKWASSGISISNNYFVHGQWPYTTAQSWRFAATSSMNSWLAANGITINKEAFIWIQGEADYTQTQGWYDGYLTPMLSFLISDGFHSSADPVILVQMAVGSAQYGAGVAASKAAAAAANPATTTALATDLYMNSDNLHYSGRGQVQLAYNAFEKIFSAPHIAV